MIILDTHIWIWNVQGDPRLQTEHKQLIQKHEADRIGISAVSPWEVAKAVELGRLILPVPIEEWIELALLAPGIEKLPLTPKIAIWSTQLPGNFHKDPFDQLIVATARVHDVPLVTADSKIRSYPHVKLA